MRQYVPSIRDMIGESKKPAEVAVGNLSEALRGKLLKRFGDEFEEIRGYNCWVYRLMDKPRQGNLFENTDPMAELQRWLSEQRLSFMPDPPNDDKTYKVLVIASDSKLPCKTPLANDLDDTPQLDGMSHEQIDCEAVAMKSAERLYKATIGIRQTGYRMDEAGLEELTKNVIRLYLDRVSRGSRSKHRFARFKVKNVAVL